ncbi:MAG TPA: hypothetical protein VMV22_13595 [Acidimicrobiales bacterium]|nr:hypothetical protein [Acidimicrobiales bacterium]
MPWTVFLVAGLLLAIAWDGDGDPTTENLPPATVTLAARVVRAADEQTDGDGGDDSAARADRPARRPRHRRVGVRARRTDRVALPSRGPPEEDGHGRA